MAFGARQEADGKWRLCLRKGRTIKRFYPGEEFEFKGQRQAKACADELNETFWDRYRKYQLGAPAPDYAWDMIICIRKHCL